MLSLLRRMNKMVQKLLGMLILATSVIMATVMLISTSSHTWLASLFPAVPSAAAISLHSLPQMRMLRTADLCCFANHFP